MLVKDVTIDKYEDRTDKFNVHGRWEWYPNPKENGLGDVIIYEISTKPHDGCIGAISKEIMSQCRNADRTDAEIFKLGTTRRHQFINLFYVYVFKLILIA